MPHHSSSNSSSPSSIDYDILLHAEGTPLAPRLSTPMLLSQPENKGLYLLMVTTPPEPSLYAGKRIAIVSTDGVEEIELTATLQYFRDRGATVDLLAPRTPSYPAAFGVQMPAVRDTHILTVRFMDLGGWIPFTNHIEDAKAEDYDAAIVPGGAWNPDVLRSNDRVLAFLAAAARAGKPTAAICHGPWVLADAGLLDGRRATAWWSIQKDLRGAGATFVDEPVVIDGNIITSRCPGDLPRFLAEIGASLLGGARA